VSLEKIGSLRSGGSDVHLRDPDSEFSLKATSRLVEVPVKVAFLQVLVI
jgi:hypothetical protein